MPSKKKSSKTPPSKAVFGSNQNYDFPSSPASVSSSSEPNHEKLLSSSLDEASAKFPSLISQSSFVGEVVGDAVFQSTGCKVWLSESAMISLSILPASLVSVSLCSPNKVLSGFPLSSLPNECARHFGFELDDLTNEEGEFFTLATVFPSNKVFKNGVRLSSNLSNTLGCPASGRTIFIHPITARLTENGNGSQYGLSSISVPVNRSEELYLSVVSLKRRVGIKGGPENNSTQVRKISSPTVPSLSDFNLSSPCSAHSYSRNNCKSELKSTHNSHEYIDDMINVEQILGDDSSRELLETCILLWLCTWSLLPGNFVVVPVLSWLCVLRVVGSKRLSLNHDMSNNTKDFLGQGSDLLKDSVPALYIDQGMKIHMLLPGNPTVKTCAESTVHPSFKHGCYTSGTVMNFPKLGGISKEFATLKDIILSSTVQATVASLGLRPTKGVLLHGPPGTGKTTLAQVCAQDAGVNIFLVKGPEIISQFHGETEQSLHKVFDKANEASPSVVFIDELDAIAPARKAGGDELSQRLVATLLNLMDGVNRNDNVLVIAATNRPESIEPALRRPGRLDREIEIGVPSPQQRHEILLALLSEMQHSLSDKDIQDLAMVTHGFVGADLAALCNEAALVRLRKHAKLNRSNGNLDLEFSSCASVSASHISSKTQNAYARYDLVDSQSLGDSVNSNLEAFISPMPESDNSSYVVDENSLKEIHDLEDTICIAFQDFEKARIRIRPSAMREVILEVPKVRWEDVGGQAEVKAQLMEAVQWPQKHMDAFERIGTRPPTGVLLFGPPGCSKTLLARAVASEAGLNFLTVKGPELFSKWVGESEKAVRSLFAKARENAPSIIFFDEIDGLAIIRGKENDGVSVGDRVISQLLVELDGLQQRGSVTVIAATNRPDKIDPALLRPGRFDRLLYVGPPNQKDREEIFRVHLQRMPCSSDVCIDELSYLTEGCTGADISLVCHEAAIAAIEESLSASEITMRHLKIGLEHVQPTDVRMYEKLSTKFQRLVHSTDDVDDPGSSDPMRISLWARIRGALSIKRNSVT